MRPIMYTAVAINHILYHTRIDKWFRIAWQLSEMLRISMLIIFTSLFAKAQHIYFPGNYQHDLYINSYPFFFSFFFGFPLFSLSKNDRKYRNTFQYQHYNACKSNIHGVRWIVNRKTCHFSYRIIATRNSMRI